MNQEILKSNKIPGLVLLGYVVILLIVVISLAVLGFYAYFSLFNSQTKTNLKDFSQHMQPLPDGWIKYTDGDLGISFEYPANWKLVDTGETIDLQLVDDHGTGGKAIMESFKFGRMPKLSDQNLQQVLEGYNRSSNVGVVDEISTSAKIYETPHSENDMNIHTISHYWDTERWVYYLDGTYYQQMHDHDTDPVLKRILISAKISN